MHQEEHSRANRRFRMLGALGAVAATALIVLATPQVSYAHDTEPSAGGLTASTKATKATKAAPSSDARTLLPADRDLLVKVRLAGLWEMPAGQMAMQKGVDPRVRQVGLMIHNQHGQLDELVVETAGRLGVQLPDEPNADQRRWLGEMGAASGRDFRSDLRRSPARRARQGLPRDRGRPGRDAQRGHA